MKKQVKSTLKKNKTDNAGLQETPASQTDDTQQPSEQWIRTFLDATSDMTFLKDENFRHIIVNPMLCKFYGKAESEIIGKTDFDLMEKRAAAECRKTDEQTLLSNDLLISEEVIGGRYYETRKFPVSIAVGKKGIGAYIRDITERKRAEEALRESERKFRDTVINLDEGYYSVTLDGVLLEHNQAFSRILGFDQAANLRGRYVPDFWQNPDDRNVYLQEFATNNFISNYQIKAKTKTGEKITVSISAHLVKDRNNLPLKIEGVVRDITERKRIEEALRASDAQLRAILDATPFPMALVDVQDNNIEYWSRSALDLFGHTAPTAHEWYELAYPDLEYRREVVDRWKHFLETARLSGKPVNTGEYRVSCHDGSVRVCELYATLLSDKLVVTFNDITERNRAEESLKENAGLLKIAGETAKLGGWSVDLRDNLCAWSDEMAAIHERPAGHSPFVEEGISYYAPEWREKITKVFTQCAQNGIPYDEEMEIITANGKRIWVRIIGKPLKDKAGKIIKVQGGFLDITERKQAESQREAMLEEISKFNKNLEQRIKERTTELTEAIDLLEETNRAFVGRELRIIELKEQIAELEKRIT